MRISMSDEKYEKASLQEVILYEMLSNKAEAVFARKVMDVIIERNDKNVNTWEYPANDRLTYFGMEANFESGIAAYCTALSIYEKAYGTMPKEIEKTLDKLAESLAEKQIYQFGWRKKENRVERIIEFLSKKFEHIQTFDTRNVVGDEMETIYEEDGVIIDYCRSWDYIEVFGLTKEEYKSLFESGVCF